MNKILKITVGVLLLSLFLSSCTDQIGDKYVSFAKCLTDKGVTIYGAYWCPHCQNQKAMFGQLGAPNLNYVECDPAGENAKPELCKQKNIQSFPTWEFPGNEFYAGELTLQKLSEKTSCPLPSERAIGTTSDDV